MELDYTKIGMRIARRRRALGLKQAQVEERAGLGYKYLSNIERGISIPSVEVIMRLAAALDTTPDAFLVGTERREDLAWQDVAQLLRVLDPQRLETARSFLSWLSEQDPSGWTRDFDVRQAGHFQ